MNKKEFEEDINKLVDIFEQSDIYPLIDRLDRMEAAMKFAETYIQIYKQPVKRLFMNAKIKYTQPVIDEILSMIKQARQYNGDTNI